MLSVKADLQTRPLKVALVGYGKMGQAIDGLASSMEVEIIERLHRGEYPQEALNQADVWIDFTHADAVIDTIALACRMKKNLVVGTTGWLDRLDGVEKEVLCSGIGLIHSANFSLSTHLFAQAAAHTSQLLQKIGGYDVALYELHHRAKSDSPSGTAKLLAAALAQTRPDKTDLLYDRPDEAIHPEQLHCASIRCGSIPGTHTIIFDSKADTIELTLRARNREAWAQGALLASKWIAGRKGIYTVEQMLNSLTKEHLS